MSRIKKCYGKMINNQLLWVWALWEILYSSYPSQVSNKFRELSMQTPYFSTILILRKKKLSPYFITLTTRRIQKCREQDGNIIFSSRVAVKRLISQSGYALSLGLFFELKLYQNLFYKSSLSYKAQSNYTYTG